MHVFRLVKAKYPNLSGQGGMRFAGRWNLVGTPIIYTAGGRAQALAEVLVHASDQTLVTEFLMLKIEVPDNAHYYDNLKTLPKDWNCIPPGKETQNLGDRFLQEGKYLGLWVPSVIVPEDQNLLLNPFHPAFGEVKVVDRLPFPIDPRLLRGPV